MVKMGFWETSKINPEELKKKKKKDDRTKIIRTDISGGRIGRISDHAP